MGKIRISLFMGLVMAGFAVGQAPTPDRPVNKLLQPKELPPLPPAPGETPAATLAPIVPIESTAVPIDVSSEIVWFRTDFLNWSIPSSRVPVPLVTTGDPTDPCAGMLDRPGTSVLYGNEAFNNDSAIGLRFTLGSWLDSAHDLGLEATGFFTFRENHRFERSSDSNGNSPLYLPAFNLNCFAEDALIIADPIAQFGGSVQSNSDLRLWGSEINGLFNLRRGPFFEWTFLSGVRYLDMRESFNLSAQSRDLILDQRITIDDQFETTNKFFGGQIGSRMRFRRGRALFDITGKFALGANQRTRTISGQSTSTGSDASLVGSFPGGFYAQPSNIGSSTDYRLAVIPALELKLAYEILPRVVASVGYDLFYLNQTARVADLIDRNLNLSQSALFGSQLPDAGQPGPQRGDRSGDIFVNGLSLGLELRY